MGSDLRWKAVLHASEYRHQSPAIDKLTVRYGADVMGDAYEPDDVCAEAQPIAPNGTVQQHTFHDKGDSDWVTFDAESNTTYLIEAQVPAGSNTDVTLELYDQCDDLPLSSQDYAFTPGIRLEYEAPTSGQLYFKLLNHEPNDYGQKTIYQVTVRTVEENPAPGALVLVAGRQKAGDRLQDNIHQVSERVYQLFSKHGYTPDRIFYLTTDLGPEQADAMPTKSHLREAITSWAVGKVAPDRPFTLYLVDHGKYDQFYLDKAQGEWVTPQEVDNWLRHLEEAVPGVKVNVIVEACNAGSFIDLPKKVSRPGRVVIASTSAQDPAWASDNGAVFSDHFVTALKQGASLFGAFGMVHLSP